MWKEYWKFTKGERIAILSLLVLVILLVVLPSIISLESPPNPKEIELVSNPPISLTDSSQAAWRNQQAVDSHKDYQEKGAVRTVSAPVSMFYFDPNKLSEQGWVKLGVSERTARTIQKYLGKGGKFKMPSDISRIYGLREEDKARLLPFVRIEGHNPAVSSSRQLPSLHTGNPTVDKETIENRSAVNPAFRARAAVIVDINAADSLQWLALPGIGSKLAGRILRFRESLGGFHSIKQVGEVYGLPDSVFKYLVSQLRCSNPTVQKININKADKQILAAHPYIRYRRADAIIKYRQEHGSFANAGDCQILGLWTPEEWAKLEPYLEKGPD